MEMETARERERETASSHQFRHICSALEQVYFRFSPQALSLRVILKAEEALSLFNHKCLKTQVL